jgi:hypothetical protein
MSPRGRAIEHGHPDNPWFAIFRNFEYSPECRDET